VRGRFAALEHLPVAGTIEDEEETIEEISEELVGDTETDVEVVAEDALDADSQDQADEIELSAAD